MPSNPHIFIAVGITTSIALLVIGAFIFTRLAKTNRTYLGLIILVMLPMNALAYYGIRIHLMSFVNSIVHDTQTLLCIQLAYAPLTEEPAKLLILFVPWFYKRISENNLTAAALAIGLGFGAGEAWTVASLIHASPSVAGYQWFMFNGFIAERFMVCIIHAAMTATALHFIIKKKAVIKGILCAMALHALCNAPILISKIFPLGLGKSTWSFILSGYVFAFLLLSIALLAYYETGSAWKKVFSRGIMKCPECATIYVRPLFKINLFHKCYEKCPQCRHWHLVSAFNYSDDTQ